MSRYEQMGIYLTDEVDQARARDEHIQEMQRISIFNIGTNKRLIFNFHPRYPNWVVPSAVTDPQISSQTPDIAGAIVVNNNHVWGRLIVPTSSFEPEPPQSL